MLQAAAAIKPKIGVIPMRNPNGHGTVYKLKGRRRHPWLARVTVGWTTAINKKGKEVPKQLYQTIGFFKSKQEAMDALTLHRFSPVSPKANITLGELYAEWSTAKYEYISKDTINNYKAAWKHLSKHTNVKLKELRTAHLQTVIDKCYKDDMSRSSLEKIRTVAIMLFNYAVENDILNKNYGEFIKLPKTEKIEKVRFTDIEIKKLTDSIPDNPWASTVLMMIYTGLRISEILGLTKFNVDLEKGIITGGIKTDAGKNRIVPIHRKISKYVTLWHEKNGEALICDDKGKKLSPKRYREKMYYPALAAAKVRKLTPHACRHTFGSLMAEAGVEPINTQKLMGHANYSTTADIYTHLEIEALKNAINKIS